MLDHISKSKLLVKPPIILETSQQRKSIKHVLQFSHINSIIQSKQTAYEKAQKYIPWSEPHGMWSLCHSHSSCLPPGIPALSDWSIPSGSNTRTIASQGIRGWDEHARLVLKAFRKIRLQMVQFLDALGHLEFLVLQHHSALCLWVHTGFSPSCVSNFPCSKRHQSVWT